MVRTTLSDSDDRMFQRSRTRPASWRSTLGCALIVAAACSSRAKNQNPQRFDAANGTHAGGAKHSAEAATATTAFATAPMRCEGAPFALAIKLKEASGAAFVTWDQTPALVVISDSGNNGEYAVVRASDGETLARGELPLGDTSDDLEGIAATRDALFGLTSAGWVYHWRQTANPAAAFELVTAPYPIGALNRDWKKHGGHGDKPPTGEGMACHAKGVNCGRNFEGLCLLPSAQLTGAPAALPANTPAPLDQAAPPPPCIGLAVAKAEGAVYCVHLVANRLVADARQRIALAAPGKLADCAISEDGTAWVGANFFGQNTVYRVQGWQTPSPPSPSQAEPTAQPPHVDKLDGLGVGFCEGIAVSTVASPEPPAKLPAPAATTVYRFSDVPGAPSAMAKYDCTPTRPNGAAAPADQQDTLARPAR